MNRRAILASVLVLASAFCVLAEEAKPAAPTLALSVAAASPQAAIGDDVTIEVKLENTGDKPVTVRELTLDKSSLTFDVKWGDKAFQYGVIRPNVYDAEAGRLRLASTTLPPKKAAVAYFDLPAVKVGKWSIAASYAGAGGDPVKSGAVDVEVTAKDGNDHLVAVLETERDGQKGKVVFHFFPDEAPNTVMSFVRLARSGFYSGLVFHRVIKDFMVQGGCPQGNGQGGPGYSIKAEFNQKKHEEGSLAMARSTHYDSAGCQFYICMKAQPRLDGTYTVFGQVEEGMDVVRQIGDVPTSGPNGKPTADRPLTDVRIASLTIEARGAAQAPPANGQKGPEPGKPPVEPLKPAEPEQPAQPAKPEEPEKAPEEPEKKPEQPK